MTTAVFFIEIASMSASSNEAPENFESPSSKAAQGQSLLWAVLVLGSSRPGPMPDSRSSRAKARITLRPYTLKRLSPKLVVCWLRPAATKLARSFEHEKHQKKKCTPPKPLVGFRGCSEPGI